MAKQEWNMEFACPAEMWNEAIPLGNGRLGAMAYGHTGIERIQLNEDTLWSSGPMERNNPCALKKLPEIQQLILNGKPKEAERLMAQYMSGTPHSQAHYEFLGELAIAAGVHTPYQMGWTPESPDMDSYKGNLDLMRGVYTIRHSVDGVSYTREMFASFPAQVLCIRLRADQPGALNLDIMMDRQRYADTITDDDRRPGKVTRSCWGTVLVQENRTCHGDSIMMAGNACGVGYAGIAKVTCNGELLDAGSQLLVQGATEACIYVAGATTNREENPKAAVQALVEKAAERGFDALLAEHIADFEPKMRACTLDLGDKPDNAGIEARLKAYQEGGEDPALQALYFTFGRYLLLSGSRVGSAAMNLQGIWNQDYTPSWDCKYTININTQMNYWPAEVTALSEETEPLWDLLEKICERGKVTARIMYGCRGSVAHHNTDLYGDTAPQDTYMAATFWPLGGAWTAMHLWDHYLFTGDKDFLQKWYPTMREFALFFVDFLIDDGHGRLVTCPSVSPENRYILPDGRDTPVCAGPAMDNQIIRALFHACLETVDILGLDEPLAEDFRRCAAKLPKDRIGSKGQLLEWQEEYPELTPGMVHISHLWAAYPGDAINWRDTPELWKAAGRSLDIRVENGSGDGGWPIGWFVCQYARLLEPEKMQDFLRGMFVRSTERHFFSVASMAGGVFQIDANLGVTAGMAEALLQSHLGILHLLPTLPPAWKQGCVRGLKARGNHTVDITWQDSALTEARVIAGQDCVLEVYGEPLSVICNGQAIATARTAHGFSFPASKGSTYLLRP